MTNDPLPTVECSGSVRTWPGPYMAQMNVNESKNDWFIGIHEPR